MAAEAQALAISRSLQRQPVDVDRTGGGGSDEHDANDIERQNPERRHFCSMNGNVPQSVPLGKEQTTAFDGFADERSRDLFIVPVAPVSGSGGIQPHDFFSSRSISATACSSPGWPASDRAKSFDRSVVSVSALSRLRPSHFIDGVKHMPVRLGR